ncbi:dTDP-6-deoxy-3,4-keto-hexulose isomerase [Limnohabitans sp. TS-CS-82]|nr:dTDP-6-deoxy-3,4-keto-hexulose isomerase [Limnohabitans sp. TS-CS-82]
MIGKTILENLRHEHRVLGDERGQLIAIESGIHIPFEIKRVFYIYGTQPNVPRGQHSHHKTKQYLIAVNGSCKVTLDSGQSKEIYELNQPNIGLFQDAMVWGTMHDFSADCVLLVLADQRYNEADYIRNYDDFKQAFKP